jgi:hypothetical protein
MAVMATSERFKRRTAHFIAHWGVPKAIHQQVDLSGLPLAILEFSPNRYLTSWRYATNGMSEHLQEGGDRKVRTELYACSHDEAPWLIQLLDALARYPIQQATFLSEYDTMPLVSGMPGVPPEFGGILLAPPDPHDPVTLGALQVDDSLPVLVHQVVLVTTSELNFAINNDGRALWGRLLKHDQLLVADKQRPSAV